MPNSPEFMQAEMALMDELNRTLLQNGVQREQIPYMLEQFKTRMQTDNGLEDAARLQQMADRGMVGSSVQSRANFEAEIPRSRTWRDALQQTGQQYADLSLQDQQAWENYERGMIGRYQGQAQQMYENPNAWSQVYSGNTDYYDPGGGHKPVYDANAPGGYIEQAKWQEQDGLVPEWYDPREWARPDYWGQVSPSGPGR